MSQSQSLVGSPFALTTSPLRPSVRASGERLSLADADDFEIADLDRDLPHRRPLISYRRNNRNRSIIERDNSHPHPTSQQEVLISRPYLKRSAETRQIYRQLRHQRARKKRPNLAEVEEIAKAAQKAFVDVSSKNSQLSFKSGLLQTIDLLELLDSSSGGHLLKDSESAVSFSQLREKTDRGEYSSVDMMKEDLRDMCLRTMAKSPPFSSLHQSALNVLVNGLDSFLSKLDLDFIEDVRPCRVCRVPSDPEKTLLCDFCNDPYHLYCLTPPLESVPPGDWSCAQCCLLHQNYDMMNYTQRKIRRRTYLKRHRDVEDSEDVSLDSDEDFEPQSPNEPPAKRTRLALAAAQRNPPQQVAPPPPPPEKKRKSPSPSPPSADRKIRNLAYYIESLGEPPAGTPLVEVQRIVGRRRKGGELQYKLNWAGRPFSDSMWVYVKDIIGCTDLIEQFETKFASRIEALKNQSSEKKKADPS